MENAMGTSGTVWTGMDSAAPLTTLLCGPVLSAEEEPVTAVLRSSW
jgi:hypothetical protein